MRKITAFLIALTVILLSHQQIHASPPAASGTIYGKVHYKGKAVRHILVEVMIGSCFSPVFKVLSTNDAGFYRVDGLPAGGNLIHVAVNGFTQNVQNKRYRATCGKWIKLRGGQLNRHNIELESR